MERKKPIIFEDEPWLISYADVVTLLLAFFVVIAAVASLSKARMEMVSSFFETKETKEGRITLYDLTKLAQDLIVQYNLQKEVKVTLTDKGVKIDVLEKLLFDSGKAILYEESMPILSSIANILSKPQVKERRIVVEGHTDSVPIHTVQYPSNWELSTARASEVIRFFTDKHNVDRNRFEAVGYADTKPVEQVVQGKDQSVNRRVTMLIY